MEKKYNPGTIVEWEHKAFQLSTGAHVIGYVFWAFAPCIEGFQFCRNVISVDGTHLYTKYRHKMLIAAAMDGNQQVLPLAFAIVDDESTSSWKWFLTLLSRHVIRGRRDECALFLIIILDVCWRAGSEYQIRKFNRIMEEIKSQNIAAFEFLDKINKEKWTASHDGGWRTGILTTNMSECINGVLKGARRLPLTAKIIL
ncbi:UNVERIFIED_CONTAM: hypothetical protein Sradi_4060200 [Sesamum radiatum]|uniref:MULE transposase domain-containing protein n=1 Tax=Sesamum radiatum TaxID=300843 RepID=A0AAW2PM51_SESRA